MKLIFPPVVQFLLCCALVYGLPRLVPQWSVTVPGAGGVAGLFFLIGFGLFVVAVAAFGSAKTTVNPVDPTQASTLVTGGVYRVTRNPMYLAMVSILIGGVLVQSNPIALAGPFLFVWMMTILQIRPEEKALTEKFGDEYTDYCRRTRRWI